MGHLMKDTPPPTHMAPVHTPITGFLMLLRISPASAHAKLFTHTSSSRRSPQPCQELALCLGPSPGCWVAVRGGGSVCLGICLFVSPVYTFQALITPGAWEEGHAAAAWAFDVGEERW